MPAPGKQGGQDFYGDTLDVQTANVAKDLSVGGTTTHLGPIVAPSITVVGPNSPYTNTLPGAPGVTTPQGVTTGKVLDFGGATYNVQAFNAKGDAQIILDAVMNGTTAVLTSASNPFVSTDVGKMCTVPGAGAAGVPLATTIASYQSAGQVTLAAVSQTAVTNVTAAPATFGTDDFAAIQAAITRAQTEFDEVMIPSVPVGYCTSAPLVISSAANVVGNGVKELFGTKITNANADAFPTTAPYLSGSVIIPMNLSQDGFQFTGVGLTQNMTNVGVRFGGLYKSTGHGFNATPPADGSNFDEGTSGSEWFGCKVYGHDGNHYGFRIVNPFYTTGYHLRSYGGGGYFIRGDTTRTFYGNCVFIHPYAVMFLAGTADGITLGANAINTLNLITWIRPQVHIRNPVLAVPGTGGGPAGAATNMTIRVDANTTNIVWMAIDLETNVSAQSNLGSNGRRLVAAEVGTSIVDIIKPGATGNIGILIEGFSTGQTGELIFLRQAASGTPAVLRAYSSGDLLLGDTSGTRTTRILTRQTTAPTVGSGGAGTSALSIVAGSTNTAGRFQVTTTGVVAGAVLGVVAFNGGALATAPLVVIVSLSAPTGGVANALVAMADTYTTSGFTIRATNAPSDGTYIVNWIAFF